MTVRAYLLCVLVYVFLRGDFRALVDGSSVGLPGVLSTCPSCY